MKRIIFLLALVLIFSSCQEKSKFSINGVIKGKSEGHIYLSILNVNTPVLIDSAKINKKGVFKFSVKATDTEFYQLGYSVSDFITILASPGEKINLRFEGKNLFENYIVTGSAESEKLQFLDNNLAESKRKLDSLSTLYEQASKKPGFDVSGPLLEQEYTNIVKEQRFKNINFILNNAHSLASIKALYQSFSNNAYVLYDPKDLQFMKILSDTLSAHYPNSKQVQALSQDFTNEMNSMYTNRMNQLAKDIPPTTLNPDLLNIDGRRISLSSLKGKYVLLTFWSYKSQECISENLQLKQYYQAYRNKGFEIYQINLDTDENGWRAAVKFDELPWISTREDDPIKPINAMLFNVKSLPANYLIDKEGNIIGSNLHGRSLQIKLDQVFNK